MEYSQRGPSYHKIHSLPTSNFTTTALDMRTDRSTLEKKERNWVQLAERFNGSTGIKETRDRAQLKACWKNLKAKAKKDAAVNFKLAEDHHQ